MDFLLPFFPPQPKPEEKPPEPEEIEPPSTFEEFIKIEKIDDWPYPLSSEGPLDILNEGLFLGTQDDIASILREAAPLGLHVLENLETRLDQIEERLHHYADQIVTNEVRPSRMVERLFHSPTRTFMTEVSDSEAIRSQPGSRRHKSVDFVDTMLETRKKSLDYCLFPGFREGELIELPGQLEAPPILHRVTNAQNFNPGFKNFWKKLFLSEASVAVMQDMFWWLFLQNFNKEGGHQVEKDLLFDRIADSYVALFTSIHLDVKDKFLTVYPDCLAQTIYATYASAFPESRSRLDDNFKQDLVYLIHELVTGIKPVPGTWKNWNVQKLDPESHGGLESEKSATAKKMLQAAALNKDVDATLDIEEFTRVVMSLGDEPLEQLRTVSTPGGFLREMTKLTNQTHATVPPSRQTLAATSMSQSRNGTGKLPRKKNESHQIGPGPKYQRVKFNTTGRSPLIAHYLHMHQLRHFKQPGIKVRRTEIEALPPPGPTYKQLIRNTLTMSTVLSKEFCKICDQTNQDIVDLEKRQRDMNREIDAIQKELTFTKNPQELRVLIEKIGDLKDRDRESPILTTDRTERQKAEADASDDEATK